MTCFHPVSLTPPGRRTVQVACGRCVGCRTDYSKGWAARCMHEASLHSENCFLTLTYNDCHLPPDGGLKKGHFQDFIKRLRRSLGRKKISYFHCGEYGADLGRPHYHALIFGHDFPDKRFHTRRNGHTVWISKTLDDLWTHGFCEIGTVTYQSAGYIARYTLKKITGQEAPGWYQKLDVNTGEFTPVPAEYLTMSRRPAIAKRWMENFHSDVFPCDFMVVDGKRVKPPRYYDKQLKQISEARLTDVKKARFKKSVLPGVRANSTPSRLRVREIVKWAALSQTKRHL